MEVGLELGSDAGTSTLAAVDTLVVSTRDDSVAVGISVVVRSSDVDGISSSGAEVDKGWSDDEVITTGAGVSGTTGSGS